jgi:methyl-accepting chemotaxis protein
LANFSFWRTKIRNISIGWKYGFALGTTIILFLISASVILGEITHVHANLKMIEEKSRHTAVISDLSSLFWAKDAPIADYVNTSNSKYVAEFRDRNESFGELLAELKSALPSAEDRKQLETIESYNAKLNDQFLHQIVPAMEEGHAASAVLLRDETQLVRNAAVESLAHLRNRIVREQQATVALAGERLDRSIRVLLASILVSSALGVAVVWLVHRFVRRNLKQVIGMASRIAEGRLDIRKSDYDGKDEVGELSLAANTMLEHLRSMVRRMSDISGMVSQYSAELKQSAVAVNESSRQVAVTMNDLAAGTATQAEAASELSDSIAAYMAKVEEARANGERIRHSSREVLELTGQGQRLMDASIRQMDAIGHIMDSAMDSMRGLDDRLKAISALGGVIHAIADQTHFLSLNAAIEAARAGEPGRGFAIVADEVRKLADHAAKSASEIAGIVDGILRESGQVADSLSRGYGEVRKGIAQIRTTGATFDGISRSVTEMADQISATSRHLTEIASGGGSIMQSIESIASVSEEAAAGVEQTSAAMEETSSAMEEIAGSAEHLAVLAEELDRLVRQFRI